MLKQPTSLIDFCTGFQKPGEESPKRDPELPSRKHARVFAETLLWFPTIWANGITGLSKTSTFFLRDPPPKVVNCGRKGGSFTVVSSSSYGAAKSSQCFATRPRVVKECRRALEFGTRLARARTCGRSFPRSRTWLGRPKPRILLDKAHLGGCQASVSLAFRRFLDG